MPETSSRPPLPIVLDTDIGTDIDDAYALVFAAASPELDLRAVTTVNGDTSLRARIARLLLDRLGRNGIPVAVGEGPAMTPGVTRGWHGREGEGIALERIDPARDFDPRPAARLLADEARAARERGTPLVVVPIGAMTNIARAILDYPEEMRAVSGIVAMASTFDGHGARPAGEHNVACDPEAFRVVAESGIPLTLVGLNVTRQTRMTAADLAALEAIGGPLVESLAGMHRVWFEHIGRDHSPMHDALAVAAVFRPGLLAWVPVAPAFGEGFQEGVVQYNRPEPGRLRRMCRAASRRPWMRRPSGRCLWVEWSGPRERRARTGRGAG
jgi:inosine-uridine nucleoside N-ribohydrolase